MTALAHQVTWGATCYGLLVHTKETAGLCLPWFLRLLLSGYLRRPHRTLRLAMRSDLQITESVRNIAGGNTDHDGERDNGSGAHGDGDADAADCLEHVAERTDRPLSSGHDEQNHGQRPRNRNTS